MEPSDSFDDLTKSVIELCDVESDAEPATVKAKGKAAPVSQENNKQVLPAPDKSLSLSPIKKLDLSLWNNAIASSKKFSWTCSTPLFGCGTEIPNWPVKVGSPASNVGPVKRSIIPNNSTPISSHEFRKSRKRKWKDDSEPKNVSKKINSTFVRKLDCIPEVEKPSIDDLLDEVSVLCDEQTMITLDECGNSNKHFEITQTPIESPLIEAETCSKNQTMVTLDACSGSNINSLGNTPCEIKEKPKESVHIGGHISTINIEEVVSQLQDSSDDSDQSKEEPAEKDELDPAKTEGRFKGLDSTRLVSVTEAAEDEDLSDNDDILGLDELTFLDDSDDSEIDETILYEDEVNRTVINAVPKEYKSVFPKKLEANGFSDPASILKDEDWVDCKRSEESESNHDNICEKGLEMLFKGTVEKDLKCDDEHVEKSLHNKSKDSKDETIKMTLIDEPSTDTVKGISEIDSRDSKERDDITDTAPAILEPKNSAIGVSDSDAIEAVSDKGSDLPEDATKTTRENISPTIATVKPYIHDKEEIKHSPKIVTDSVVGKESSPKVAEQSSRKMLPTSPSSQKSVDEHSLATVAMHNTCTNKQSGLSKVSCDENQNLKAPVKEVTIPTAKRKCFQNENALMQNVMKKWSSCGIQSQDVNLTCAVSHRAKHENKPGMLENDHISVLTERSSEEQNNTKNVSDSGGNSFAGVYLQELRNEFKLLLRKGEEIVQNVRNEYMHKKCEQEQKNREAVRNLLLLQGLEFRRFQVEESHMCQYNPGLAQYRVMQLNYEHNRQREDVQQQCSEKINTIDTHYNDKLEQESQRINEDKTHLQAIIQQLDSEEGSQKLSKYGPPISVKLTKAPHKGNPQKSIIAVCLPAKVASAIMREDDLLDTYYKY